MKNIKIEFTNERIIPASGLAVVGAILGKSDFVKHCNRMDVTPNRSQHQIKNGDILLTYIGMLYMGKPDFQAVHEMDDDRDFYKTALGIAYNIPSEETLRQRMDVIGSSLREYILKENVELLRTNGIVPSKLSNGFVPVDIDVTPFDNSKTRKEGVSVTYAAVMPILSSVFSFIILSSILFSFSLNSGALRPQSLLLRKLASSALVRTRARFACWRHIPNPIRMSSSMTNRALTS